MGAAVLRIASPGCRPYYRLGRLALRYSPLLLAVHHYRVGERRDPHHYYKDVDQERKAPTYPDGFQERLHVDDEDEAADSGAHDASWQDANDPGRYRRRDEAADQQRSDQLPRNVREAEGDKEPEAGSKGHDELACVHRAYHLAWLHPPGGEEGRRGDRTPAATTRRIKKPGHKSQRADKRSGDRPLPYRPLVPPKRKSREDEDSETEQQHRDDRLGRLGRDDRSQHHGAEEGSYGPRYGKPYDLGPVHVAESPVRGARHRTGPHLRDVYARRGERRRDPHRQQERS